MGIGKRIQELCNMQGLSIRKLSIMANVPYSTLYSIIKRDSAGADGDTINRIAKALNVTVADILIDVNEMVDILSQSITNERVQQLEEKIKSGAERWNAFITSIRAVGYDIDIEKNAEGNDSYTFYRKNKTWMHQIPEKDMIAMLCESLSYTEFLCIRMEKKLEDGDGALQGETPSPEGKDTPEE